MDILLGECLCKLWYGRTALFLAAYDCCSRSGRKGGMMHNVQSRQSCLDLDRPIRAHGSLSNKIRCTARAAVRYPLVATKDRLAKRIDQVLVVTVARSPCGGDNRPDTVCAHMIFYTTHRYVMVARPAKTSSGRDVSWLPCRLLWSSNGRNRDNRKLGIGRGQHAAVPRQVITPAHEDVHSFVLTHTPPVHA